MNETEKTNFVISPSALNNAHICLLKYNYSNVRQITLAGPKPKYLEQGGFLHLLLEKHYKLVMTKEVPLGDVITQTVEYGRLEALKNSLTLENSEQVIRVYKQYAFEKKNESWIIKGVEVPFSKILYEDNLIRMQVEGKIDLLVQMKEDEPIFPVDHKSSDKDKKLSSLNNQFITYPWAAEGTDILINKFIFTKEPKFSRELISYSPARIEKWVNNTIDWIFRLDHAIKNNHFPESFTFNCSRCQFNRLCEASPDAVEYIINRDYVKTDPHDLFKKEEVNGS